MIGYVLRSGFGTDKSHLVLLDIDNLVEQPKLKAFLEFEDSFDRLKLKMDGQAVILGCGNNYETYSIKPFAKLEPVLESLSSYTNYNFLI